MAVPTSRDGKRGQRQINGEEHTAALGPVLHVELGVAAQVGVNRHPANVEVVADLRSDREGPALDVAERLWLPLVRRELHVGVADRADEELPVQEARDPDVEMRVDTASIPLVASVSGFSK
jgi:hypothetical protein